MKKQLYAFVLLMAVVSTAVFGQMIKRTDAIWARTSPNPITVDGVLNEADWAKAESLQINFLQDNGMPGSGYTTDGWTIMPTDPLRSTVKFLVNGDSLYIAVIVKDSSVGGGPWPGPAKWEGVLSNMRNKSKADRPVPNGEIYYAWNTEGWADPNTGKVGAMPGYFGPVSGANRWTDSTDGLPKAKIWDAKTTVDGVTNADSVIDKGYVMEFKVNLKYYGYDVKGAAGDIIMYSIAIYDCDWQWFRGADTTKNRFTVNKAWAQGPWGGNNNNHIRIFAKPTVTTAGTVPNIDADLVIPGAGALAAPNLDGKLDEAVWNAPAVGTLHLRYGNAAIRNAYPNTAPFRSGQFQPDVNGGKAAIIDGDTGTVKYFYKDNDLYLGFRVKDKVVQSVPGKLDRWDGFRVMITARNSRNGDSVLNIRRMTFILDSVGNAMRMEDLAKGAWDSSATAVTVKTSLNAGTTVDTLGLQVDNGYTAEMKVDLLSLGYPAGRGDGVLFFGVCMFDGDSFDPPSTSYGSRVWFMREQDWQDGAAWMWMDPNKTVTSVSRGNAAGLNDFALLGNYPNPFNPTTTISFTMPQANDVTLEVFDVLGRLVATQHLGMRTSGVQDVSFNASHLASGVYNYRLRTAANQVVVGRMMLLK